MMKQQRKLSRVDLADARPATMSGRIVPMAATLVKEPFDDPDWVYEIKWDGYRAVAEVDSNQVRFYSRQQRPFDRRFSPIVDFLKRLHNRVMLDGELTVLDEHGKARFEWLQHYPRFGGNLVYYAFDLLHLDGYDLCHLPLERRKQLLAEILPDLPRVRLSEHIEREGKALFQATAESGVEGIIAKHRRSIYRPGQRSSMWKKIKHRQTATVLICGFTENPASVLVGVKDAGELRYVGQVEFGISLRMLKTLEPSIAPLVQDACPFAKKPRIAAPVRWLKPALTSEVTFQEWTSAGHLRHASFRISHVKD